MIHIEKDVGKRGLNDFLVNAFGLESGLLKICFQIIYLS